MKIRFKRPYKLSGHLLFMATQRARPKIENKGDLISFCRKSKSEYLRAFGIIVDPRSTKQEILSLSDESIEKIFASILCPEVLFELIQNAKAALFSPVEASAMLKSNNLMHKIIGARRAELTTAELIEILDKYGDCEEFEGSEQQLTAEIIMSKIAGERLREELSNNVTPEDLRRLGNKGGFYRLLFVVSHPNTPVDLLFEIRESTNDIHLIDELGQNLSQRGLTGPLLDPAQHAEIILFREGAAQILEKFRKTFLSNDFSEVKHEDKVKHEMKCLSEIDALFSNDVTRSLEAASYLYFYGLPF